MDKGQDLYLRLANSELLADDARARRSAVIAATSVVCAVAAISVSLGFIICWNRNLKYKTWRYARAYRNNGNGVAHMQAEKSLNAAAVVSIDLAIVEKATSNFSKRNEIGEGAFAIRHRQ
ncbi:unnamed protein product [Urochloa humidicola]